MRHNRAFHKVKQMKPWVQPQTLSLWELIQNHPSFLNAWNSHTQRMDLSSYQKANPKPWTLPSIGRPEIQDNRSHPYTHVKFFQTFWDDKRKSQKLHLASKTGSNTRRANELLTEDFLKEGSKTHRGLIRLTLRDFMESLWNSQQLPINPT